MTIAEWLFESMKKLGEAGVDSPRRDALVLLEDTLGKDRSWVLARPEYNVRGPTSHILEQLVARRIGREPLAYIRGKAWFYGRFFDVTPDVMIPRPESEAFINLLKQILEGRRKKEEGSVQIIDIGTGSGCLAITAKLEFANIEVIATDTSRKALEIAKKNAQKHQVDIKFLHGSLLESLPHSSFLIPHSVLMANLPYVPEGLITSPEITQEPPEALFSGEDGLNHYRDFWKQVSELSSKPEYILIESLENQHQALVSLAQKAGYGLEKTEVLVQLFKI